jgi:hypothetical protein
MAALKSVELEVEGTKDLALVSRADDSVWIVVNLRWWDLPTLLWWWIFPTDKKALVKLTFSNNTKVTFRAVRVASRFVYIRGFSS